MEKPNSVFVAFKNKKFERNDSNSVMSKWYTMFLKIYDNNGHSVI